MVEKDVQTCSLVGGEVQEGRREAEVMEKEVNMEDRVVDALPTEIQGTVIAAANPSEPRRPLAC